MKKVVSLENKEQSYALYLPSNYTPEKKWPAIFIFDPDGQGSVPVGIFQAAAEKYGFVIFGSNNTRNGLGSEKQAEFIRGFWKDTHRRFAIDEKRTYAAGYSGGARLANNFAYSCKGCIAGVVSCGASFPPEFPLGKDLPYAIFGTAGVNDYNYPEMVRLDESLGKLKLTHHLATFDGAHDWLSAELAFDAIEWFNTQAMKTGRMAKDPAFIKEIIARREKEAEKLLSAGKILEAYTKYDSLARDLTSGLSGLADGTQIAVKRDRLADSEAYEKARADEDEQFTRQTATKKRVFSQAEGLLDPDAKEETIRALTSELTRLREQAAAKDDSGERRLARRTLRGILAEANESGMYIYMQKKDYRSAAVNFELASLVYPSNPYIEVNRARALALDGRKKEAVEALKKAVEKGLKDCAAFGGEAAFADMKNNKDLIQLKASIKCAD